ncbi:MAG: alaS [Gammaproteobacteria bacterium]|jgi:alanyl-tRNA synthetase|nr:alaS [Gammaproteobacteria bacterium]
MKSAELRKLFLNYFQEQGHTIVPSSSLVPGNDPTLLFTNAGMVQFKDVFLGLDSRSYSRATTVQRCVRAGGKHNDLENVGYTARHHTFFEMLGNFSFGDYFKREAIRFAWSFLTQVLKLPKEKLWVTVFEKDDETAEIWLKELKIDPSRFSRCGEKDNFWAMGDVGPCGPCTEIFYDHGPLIPGGPPGSPDADGDRYIEIWNIVFMQFERLANGELKPLTKPSVDTGMGLERLAAVMQGVHSNYDTDTFKILLTAIAELVGKPDLTHASLRVIADHIRSSAFLITDGIIPANEDRGYVLRRIIRRAVRHGHKLGLKEPFFYKLVIHLVTTMGEAYPELANSQAHIERVLKQEEEQFARTLEHGLKLLDHELAKLTVKVIPGDIVFKLYDTYGFPPDLTADIAREQGFSIDQEGFNQAMQAQRGRSREASHFALSQHAELQLQAETDFIGYETLSSESQIVALLADGKTVAKLTAGSQGIVVLDSSPFYAEGGGQLGDKGLLRLNNDVVFVVQNTQKQAKAYLHSGFMQTGSLKVGDKVRAAVDEILRKATMLNHSATHLLHAALRKILGQHVLQKGSLVEPARLRFDFAHFEPIGPEQLTAIERLVNQQIRANHPVITELATPEQAKQKGALALFGEKYDARVRILSMGDFSMELCGGTHVNRTGDIGLFKIVSESGIAAGIRRIEAVTGEYALDWLQTEQEKLAKAAQLLKTDVHGVLDKLTHTLERQKLLDKDLSQLKRQLAGNLGNELVDQAVDMNGIKVLAQQIPQTDAAALRELLDRLKQKLSSAVIVLASVLDNRVVLIAGVTQDCLARVHAGELVNYLAQQVGGKGGGRPDLAQAGGTQPEALPTALKSIYSWVEAKIK